MLGWFLGFGNFISGLLGIFCAWKILVICLNTTLNISILYQTFRCSIKILAGILSSMTHYVMYKKHTQNNKLQSHSNSETTIPFTEAPLNSNCKVPTPNNHNICPIIPSHYLVKDPRRSF